MPIKSFRGLIADNGQDTIVLHTNDGSTGYKVVKFEIIDYAPGTLNTENLIKMHKIQQPDNIPAGTDLYSKVDFNDPTLLGVGFRAPQYASGDGNIIFDGEIFNQDIYITHSDISGNNSLCNYYIELEQIKLDLNENTVATLKDIRNNADQ